MRQMAWAAHSLMRFSGFSQAFLKPCGQSLIKQMLRIKCRSNNINAVFAFELKQRSILVCNANTTFQQVNVRSAKIAFLFYHSTVCHGLKRQVGSQRTDIINYHSCFPLGQFPQGEIQETSSSFNKHNVQQERRNRPNCLLPPPKVISKQVGENCQLPKTIKSCAKLLW